MNKIFKVIWNVVTQTWVVVSELTCAHTKRASATVATAVLATLLFATVQASVAATSGTTGTNDLHTYGDASFNVFNNSATDLNRHVEDAYKGLLNLNEKGADKSNFLVADNTTATVGNLRKLGWVLSSKNGTRNEKSQQVKHADEVLFEGKDGVTVTSKSENGKHTVTFTLEKDLDVKTAKVSDKLSIGSGNKQINVTSTVDGLNFAKETAVNGDTNIQLRGIGSTLTDTITGTTKSATNGVDVKNHNLAASVKDVLSAGWNLQGNGVAVDFVNAYDTVNFTDDGETTKVTVTQKENGKGAEVKIGAKTSVIKEKDGKLFTGKDNKEKNQVDSTTTTDNTDEGNGLVTAKAVIDAVNKAGWRVKCRSS